MIHIKALNQALDHELILKSSQRNQVQSKRMTKAVRRCENVSEDKCQKWLWQGVLQINEQPIVQKDYGKCNESQRHQTSDNW